MFNDKSKDDPELEVQFLNTSTVPQSDYLMTQKQVTDKGEKTVELKFIFENDPGRRNRNLVGARHLKNISTLRLISRNLLLMRFGKGELND